MSPTERPAPTPIRDTSAIKVAIVIIIGSFMTVLDGTIMNVALPALQDSFRTSTGALVEFSTLAWTVTGYVLAQAAIIPLTDWCAKRVGARRLYVAALALFTLASLACALAPSLTWLIVLRIVQGLGGGCLMPLGTAILARAAGPARLGKMMAFMGVPMLLGPVLGPILGGWILEYATWQWIFLINLPVGAVGVAAALAFLPRDRPSDPPRLDLLGVLLMSPGLALTLWSITSEGGAKSLLSGTVLIPLAFGLVMIGAFVFRSVRIPQPLLDLRVVMFDGFRRPIVVMVFYQMGFFGELLIIPAYLLQVRGLTTIETGLLMAPQGLASMLTMPIASSLVDRMPVGRIVPWGLLALTGSTVALTQIGAHTPLWALAVILLVQGLGLGGTFMPTSTAAIKYIPHDRVGNATTLFSIFGQVASATGIALVSVLLARRLAAYDLANQAIGGGLSGAELARGLDQAGRAYAQAFWLPVVFIFLSLLASLRLPRRKEEHGDPDGSTQFHGVHPA